MRYFFNELLLNELLLRVGASKPGPVTASRMRNNRLTSKALLLAASVLGLSAPAHSAPLNLVARYPDFVVNNLQYAYTYAAGIGNLSVTGTIGQYTEAVPGFTTSVISSASFNLLATLDTASCAIGPNCVTAGSFRLFGDVRDPVTPTTVRYDGFVDLDPGPGVNRDPNVYLLGSNSLSQFGSSNTTGSTGVLEFVFLGASGVVPAALGRTGETGGMILSVNTSTLTNFQNQVLTQSWSGTGVGDVFVPLPGAVWLLGSGLLALFAAARKRRGSDRGELHGVCRA